MTYTYHLSTLQLTGLAALAIWDLAWRGIALWKAGGRRQLAWFVVLLVINSAGILPIMYLLLNMEHDRTKQAA